MPEADNNDLADVTIQDLVFKAPQPYGEGHVLTANEAAALNQTYVENLRNNFAPKVRQAREAVAKRDGIKADAVTPDMLDAAALAADFSKYCDEYEFGTRRGGRVLDPVERELNDMATELVKKALRAKNIKLNSVTGEQMEKYVQGAISKHPELRTEAERRVEVLRASAATELGDVLEG